MRTQKSRNAKIALTAAGTALILLLAVAAATGGVITGDNGPSGPPAGGEHHGGAAAVASQIALDDAGGQSVEDSDPRPTDNTDALPCTGARQATNFEIFSAGPAPEGLPLTGTMRECEPESAGTEWPNNYVNYSYGECQIAKGATGCRPPLVIQTWPACQRSKDEYTFEGEPLPYRQLPNYGGAEVVEFEVPERRIEVYTGTSTIVIFATDPELGRRAVQMLRPQSQNKPAFNAPELNAKHPEGLAPPVSGSTEGLLQCRH